jgi:NMD protein affecting ribosome stability and mRNA decay
MTGPSKHRNQPGAGRGDRLLREWVHDPYKSKSKLPEPTLCPQCGAVFHRGRWQWARAEAGAHETLCPACHRANDGVPAGILSLNGEFLQKHRDEILHLIRNLEEKEKAEHPLKRIMSQEQQDDGGVVINFTDPHLARAAGEGVHSAYEGELEFHYTEGDTLLRLRWER